MLCLNCSANNTNPAQPVVWVKDGYYFSSVNGSQFCITTANWKLSNVQGKILDDEQGYYHCEFWGVAPNFNRTASVGALVTFEVKCIYFNIYFSNYVIVVVVYLL